MTRVSIRRCGPERAPALAKLGERTFRESYGDQVPPDDLDRYVRATFSLAAVERTLHDPRTVYYLAERGTAPVAYLKVNLPGAHTDLEEHDSLEIESIYVAAEHHRMGIGRALIDRAIAVASAARLTSIWLGVWERNPGAIAFYERLGFRKFGVHGFQLGRIRYRDVLMRLDLG